LFCRDKTELVIEDVIHVTMQNVIHSSMGYCFFVVVNSALNVRVTNCLVEKVTYGGIVTEGKFITNEELSDAVSDADADAPAALGADADAPAALGADADAAAALGADADAAAALGADADAAAALGADADAAAALGADAAVFQRVLNRPARSGAYVPGTGGISECDTIVETLITTVYDSAEAAIGIALNSIAAISPEARRAVNRIPPEVRNKFQINLPEYVAPGPILANEENDAAVAPRDEGNDAAVAPRLALPLRGGYGRAGSAVAGKRGRGRPRKHPAVERLPSSIEKRGRGRPRKHPAVERLPASIEKRGRGRPRMEQA
jgi:hypothetical protein